MQNAYIVESVDSICRDSTDTQYMLIQIFQNLQNSLQAVITPYRLTSSVFMTKNAPSGTKKHCESTEPESHQTAKMFFFFKRASLNLRGSFTMVFAQNSSIFTEQCTSPSHFSRLEVTRGDSNRSLKNYGSFTTHFFFTLRMRTNHLAAKCNYYARLLN